MPTGELAALPHSAALIWILALPLIGCASLGLFGKSWPRRMVVTVGCTAVLAAFLMTLAALLALQRLPEAERSLGAGLFEWAAGGPFTLSLGLLGDPLALWFCLVITGVGFLIHVYSAGYMAEEPDLSRYFAHMNLFIFMMSLLVLSDNFLGLLIGWAGVGLSSYLLIGFWRERPEAVAAARKAFVVNTIGDAAMILALLLIWHKFRTLEYLPVLADAPSAGAGLLTAIALLLLVAAAAKSAQLPLHTWLPDAMQGPTPVSALIHAATMVTAGVYLVARTYPIFAGSPAAALTVAVVGGLTAFAGATIAAAQYDIKRVLAYSTMSQVGYMILAAGVGAFTAGLFHFLTHAFFKALLFLSAGIVIHALAGEQDIRRMGGLGRKLPFAYWTFLAGTLALAGVPLFSGFFSKDEILAAVLATGHPWLWALGLITAGLTAYYMLRLFCLVFAGEAAGEATRSAHGGGGGHKAEAHATPKTMAVPVAILAVLSVVGGYIAFPGVTEVPAHFLSPWFERYPGGLADGAHAGGLSLILAVGAAVLGIMAGLALYRPGGAGRNEPAGGLHGFLGRGYFLDQLYHACVVLPIWGLGRLCSEIVEPWVIQGVGGAIARGVAAAGRSLSGVQTGYLRRYSLTLVAGIVVLVAYAVWPR